MEYCKTTKTSIAIILLFIRCSLAEEGISVDLSFLYKNPIDLNNPPMWDKPCSPGDLTVGVKKVKNVVEKLDCYFRVQFGANQAETAINSWKDEWSLYIFNVDYEAARLQLENVSFSIFPNESDDPFVNLSPSDNVTTILNDLIKKSKLIALGMEDIVHDQFQNKDKFAKKFEIAYKNLKVVICELTALMIQLDLPYNNARVTRSILDPLRDMKPQFELDKRNFHIVRQYINMMVVIARTIGELAPLSVNLLSN